MRNFREVALHRRWSLGNFLKFSRATFRSRIYFLQLLRNVSALLVVVWLISNRCLTCFLEYCIRGEQKTSRQWKKRMFFKYATSHWLNNVQYMLFWFSVPLIWLIWCLIMKKIFICKQTLRVSQTSVNIARHCAVKDCENGDYALEKWKETHSCSTRTLSRICTCDEPSR